MSLTPEQIKALLSKPEKAKRGTRKRGVDTSVRDHQTWFKLAQSSLDENQEPQRCDNPDCIDPRPPEHTPMGEVKVQFVAEVSGQKMCRYCFLNGWLVEDSEQLRING